MKKIMFLAFAVLGGFFLVTQGCRSTHKVVKNELDAGDSAIPIEATAQVDETHPEIEEGVTCADCHEVLVDTTSRATEVWLYKDYLTFSAGEGLESNEKTKKHILDILGGKKKKNTYILATCVNNVPLATTFDGSINPDTMTMYIFSEKGTEKLSHMRANPRVSIGWHHEFTAFGKTLCMQMRGTAEVIDDPARYDEGLAVYPFEEFARQRKMDPQTFANQAMKKFMTMTKITLNQIIITDSEYSRKNGVRVHQIWKRQD